jgi:hypothetical protein
MRCLDLPKGLLESFELFLQCFALISLLLEARAELITHVDELLLGVVLLIITPTIITFIITFIIFYLSGLVHKAYRRSVEEGRLVVDGDTCKCLLD